MDVGHFVTGLAAGIGLGLAIGLGFVRKRKPWAEMSEGEKRLHVGFIVAGVVLLAAGMVTFFLIR
jgi:hypothetical protein